MLAGWLALATLAAAAPQAPAGWICHEATRVSMGSAATIRACGPDRDGARGCGERGARRGGPPRRAAQPLPRGHAALAREPRGRARAGCGRARARRAHRRVPALEPGVARCLRRDRRAADEGLGLLPRRGSTARRGADPGGARGRRLPTRARRPATPQRPLRRAGRGARPRGASARATPPTASWPCCDAEASLRRSSTSAAAASTGWAPRPEPPAGKSRSRTPGRRTGEPRACRCATGR